MSGDRGSGKPGSIRRTLTGVAVAGADRLGPVHVVPQAPVPNPAAVVTPLPASPVTAVGTPTPDTAPPSFLGPDVSPNSAVLERKGVPNPANALAHAATEESPTTAVMDAHAPPAPFANPARPVSHSPRHTPRPNNQLGLYQNQPAPHPSQRRHPSQHGRGDGTFGDGPIRVVCRKCQRPVWGWKLPFGVSCPAGRHHAHLSWPMVAIVLTFYGSVAAMMIFLITLLAG